MRNSPFVSPAETGPAPTTYSFEQTSPRSRGNTMEWEGTVGGAISDLELVLSASDPGASGRDLRFFCKPPEQPVSTVFWNPGLIMRSIIDSHVTGQPRIHLVNEAARFALQFYAHGEGREQLQALRESVAAHGLLGNIVKQPSDGATLYATYTDSTSDAARRLLDRTTRNVFMMPLCHGGFVAGMQMALEYQRLSPGSSMNLYPVRYSRDKLKDTAPYLSAVELEYISEAAQDRTVVVFDEDTYSGHSIGGAMQALQERLPDHEIIGLAANDQREEEAYNAQGTWWESYDPDQLINSTY